MKLGIPAFPLDAINRALASDAGLRAQWAAHAGSAFAVHAGPLHSQFVVTSDGQLAFPADGTAPALTLTIAPHDLPALLQDPARFDTLVRVDGDAALAGTLRAQAQTLPWLVERALASTFGAVAGQRMADAGRAALGYPADAAARLNATVAAWLRDETEVLVRRDDGVTHGADIDALHARLLALGERVTRLEAARSRP